MASSRPNAIILGGLNTCSRALSALLVPPEGEPLVQNLRIVDKYSVSPATTYLGSEFPNVLARPNVEYRQANLQVPSIVSSVFDPPEGQAPYDYVFDLTGEVRQDRSEQVQINTTFAVSRLIGFEAAKRNVKAYVRLTHPFYETPEKGTHDEKEDIKPASVTGTWWHETLRALGAIPELNLAIVRIGLVYGPYVDFGRIAKLVNVAAVYGYMKKPMKALHSPGKQPINTIHIDDVVAGLWAAAQWMASTGRKEADSLAGEEIIFHNNKSKMKGVEGAVSPDTKVIAPLFNLVDDNETTWVKAGTTATAVFGTTFEFFNLIVNTMAKFNLEDQVEEINEHHVGGWTEMITTSDPPITKTPLNAYMDVWDLERHTVAFNNSKFKEVIGLNLKRPQFGEAEIVELVDKWKAEHTWPNLK